MHRRDIKPGKALIAKGT